MNNTKAKPFFSALLDPRVQYIAEPNTWINTFFSAINRFISYVGMHHVYPESLQRKKLFLSQAEGLQPPNVPHPMLKVRTEKTFNHVFSFIKHQGHIWYALRKSEYETPLWQLFYIDKLDITPEQFARAEMIADGENFMLRVPGDDSDTVYYKKVIDEKREGDTHIITNLCEEPSAIDNWFTLPFFNWFKPSQWGKRLSLAKNAKWAMSNAAEYKYEVVDERGIKHAHLPITIVYEYHNELVTLYDPYVEKESSYKVSLPYKAEKDQNIEASASTLFVASHLENHGKQRPFLYSHYLDYDSEGLHPLISVTFNHQDHKRRLLPINQTKTHRLPMSLKEIDNLTVLQCNHRPHSLEIRVASKVNLNGFYFKQINDERWQYYDLKTRQIRDNIRHSNFQPPHRATVYQGRSRHPIHGHAVSCVTLHDFDPNATFCHMEFKVNGKTKHLILRKHKNLIKSFVGHEAISWSLNPSPRHPDASFLSGEQSIAVEVNLIGDTVQIQSKQQNNPFTFQLRKNDNHNKALLFSNSLARQRIKPSSVNQKTLSNKNPASYQPILRCQQ